MARERDENHYDDRYKEDRQERPRKGPEPDLLAYTVKDRGNGQDAVWNRIGAAWKHRDGQGYDVALSSNPLDGRISLRENRMEEFKESRRRDDAPVRKRER